MLQDISSSVCTNPKSLEIQTKTKQFEEAKNIVKSQFIGLDDEIEKVFDALRVWFITPSLVTQPIIINLFSMSGGGKTSLVRAISKAFDLTGNNYAEFDMAQGENSSIITSIRNRIGDTALNSARTSPIMFLFDEIQKFATKNEKGEHKDKTTNQDYWTLLSDGLIPSSDAVSFGELKRCVKDMKQNGIPFGVLEASDYTEDVKTGKYISRSLLNKYNETVMHNSENPDELLTLPELVTFDAEHCAQWSFAIYPVLKSINYRNRDTCFDDDYREVLHHMLKPFMQVARINKLTLNEFQQLDTNQVYELIEQIEKSGSVKSYYDLSNCVFVNCGNLDDIYASKAVGERQVEADYFRDKTSKITINDVKYSLGKLFRPEQVARFGNIIIAYKSFSNAGYQAIISQKLEELRINISSALTDYNLTIDNSIHELIYINGVYPAQGTRPVYSTINIVQSCFSELVFNSYVAMATNGTVKYNFVDQVIELTDNLGNTFAKPFVGDHVNSKKEIDLSLLTHNSVAVATAIVFCCALFNAAPSQMISSEDSDNCLVIYPSVVSSKKNFEKKISLELCQQAGLQYFFGDNASLDDFCGLSSATDIAINLFRFKGQGRALGVPNGLNEIKGRLSHSQSDIEAESLLQRIFKETQEMVENHASLITDITSHLINNNGTITHEELFSITNLYQIFPQICSDTQTLNESFDEMFEKRSLQKQFTNPNLLFKARNQNTSLERTYNLGKDSNSNTNESN